MYTYAVCLLYPSESEFQCRHDGLSCYFLRNSSLARLGANPALVAIGSNITVQPEGLSGCKTRRVRHWHLPSGSKHMNATAATSGQTIGRGIHTVQSTIDKCITSGLKYSKTRQQNSKTRLQNSKTRQQNSKNVSKQLDHFFSFLSVPPLVSYSDRLEP
jgi:hypothetical protein